MEYTSSALASVTAGDVVSGLRTANNDYDGGAGVGSIRYGEVDAAPEIVNVSEDMQRQNMTDFMPDPLAPTVRTSVRKDLGGESLNERILDSYAAPGSYVGERVVEQHNVYGYKTYMTVEKIVEVPQVIVKERVNVEKKIDVQERIIEVPKVEIQESFIEVPVVKKVEKTVEVPQIIFEDKIIHETKIEVQERIIEVPKIIYEEVVEYEDKIEYREVPVDTYIDEIIEEYVTVPKPQEVMVPMYEYVEVIETDDVPMVQMQEVERIEEVPIYEYVAVPQYKYIPVQQYRYVYPDGTNRPLDAPPPGYPPLQEPTVAEGLQYDPRLGTNPSVMHTNPDFAQGGQEYGHFAQRDQPTPPRPRPISDPPPQVGVAWKRLFSAWSLILSVSQKIHHFHFIKIVNEKLLGKTFRKGKNRQIFCLKMGI